MDTEQLIPDFDVLEKISIALAAAEVGEFFLKAEIKNVEAMCIREAMLDETYWHKNKPPTAAYCERVIAILGNTIEESQELNRLRKDLGDIIEKKSILERRLARARDKLDLYRTLSANERKTFL